MNIDDKAQAAPAIRSVAAGRGLDWITGGWALFLRAPGPWIVLTLLVFVISMICTVVPGSSPSGRGSRRRSAHNSSVQ